MKNLLSLGLITAMGIWAFIYLLETNQLPHSDERITVQVLFIVFMLFFVIEFARQVKALRKNENLPEAISRIRNWFRSESFILFAAFTVLLIIAKPLGFFVSCFIFMAYIIFYLGGKNIKQFILIPLFIVSISYLLFSVILSVPFPSSSLLI